ncbi:MAG: hypothetical protein AAF363_13205 [Bacteroidota bacterium]
MIGFFEYQYLKFKKSHLRSLVALAKSDGHFDDREKEFLEKVGVKYGLKEKQIAKILSENVKVDPLVPETHEQKVGQLYDVIGMVLADEVIEEKEMEFCQDLFSKYGYKEEMIEKMIDMAQTEGIRDYEDWENFLEESKTYQLS